MTEKLKKAKSFQSWGAAPAITNKIKVSAILAHGDYEVLTPATSEFPNTLEGFASASKLVWALEEAHKKGAFNTDLCLDDVVCGLHMVVSNSEDEIEALLMPFYQEDQIVRGVPALVLAYAVSIIDAQGNVQHAQFESGRWRILTDEPFDMPTWASAIA